MLENYTGYIERQWFTGLSTRLSLLKNNYSPLVLISRMKNNGIPLQLTDFQQAECVQFALWLGENNLPATFDQVDGGFFRQYPMLSLEGL
jgi:hypothetical protein